MLEKHSPAYLVVNRQHDIVRFSGGQTGRYLEPSSGVATLALFSILRKSLRPTVRAAVDKAFASRQAVVHDNLRIRIDGQSCAVRVIVEPVIDDGADMGLCAVAFEDLGAIAERGKAKGAAGAGDSAAQALEDELARTREQLQSALDEAEGANEETRSSAEEYQSVNEELQSSNEELETAKEEMQSINEELQTQRRAEQQERPAHAVEQRHAESAGKHADRDDLPRQRHADQRLHPGDHDGLPPARTRPRPAHHRDRQPPGL